MGRKQIFGLRDAIERSGKRETIEYNGIRFYRYPQSSIEAHRKYFQPHIHARLRGIQALHIEIWKFANGPLPEGLEVHHSDGDHGNNDPDNLVAISRSEHASFHASIRSRSPERMAHLAAIQPLSRAWHSTPAGRKWHSEHSKAIVRIPFKKNCEFCDDEYEAKLKRSRFCSQQCSHRKRFNVKRFSKRRDGPNTVWRKSDVQPAS